MPELSEAALLSFFSEFAYQPYRVYGLIVLFMLASSFGFPVPEEIVLVTAGLVAYMAKDVVNFPPPYPGAIGVNVTTLAIVCFLAVFLSDLLVYLIGKFFGKRIINSTFFRKRIQGKIFDTINEWFKKYGGWACGIFRFTPGLRFTGHLSCGLLGVPLWKFILVDGLAALISVPTQIILVAAYGDVVLAKMKEFKLGVLLLLTLMFLIFIGKKLYMRRKTALLQKNQL